MLRKDPRNEGMRLVSYKTVLDSQLTKQCGLKHGTLITQSTFRRKIKKYTQRDITNQNRYENAKIGDMKDFSLNFSFLVFFNVYAFYLNGK